MRQTEQREEALLRLLRFGGQQSVADLAESLGVGAATLRRDLCRLSGEGRVLRTYGGAILPDTVLAAPSVDGVEPKRAIAEVARRLVGPGQTIVISSGTTTLEFARRLNDIEPLTVITNSLDVANALIDRQGIELIVMGGAVRPRMHSLLGHLTDLASTELRGDILFMGVPAVSPDHGLLSDHMPEILTDRALKEMVPRVVVLADASKFRHIAPAVVFGLDEVDTIVTDDDLEPAIQQELARRGVELIVAQRAPHSAHGVAY